MFFIDFRRLWMRNSLEAFDKNVTLTENADSLKLKQFLGIAITVTAQGKRYLRSRVYFSEPEQEAKA